MLDFGSASITVPFSQTAVWQRLVEILHGAVNARQCGGICLGGFDPGTRTHGRHQDHLVSHIIENQHQRRTDQDRVRHPDRIRRHLRELLDEPHGVVAHETENAAAIGGKASGSAMALSAKKFRSD